MLITSYFSFQLNFKGFQPLNPFSHGTLKCTIHEMYQTFTTHATAGQSLVVLMTALLQQSFLFWREMLVLWVCCCSADRDNKPRTTVEKYFWGLCGGRHVNRAKTETSFPKNVLIQRLFATTQLHHITHNHQEFSTLSHNFASN